MIAILLATLVGLAWSGSGASATSCGGVVPSSVAFRAADRVFLGTVVRSDGPRPWSRMNPDGSFSGGLTSDPFAATFDIVRTFKGPEGKGVAVAADAHRPHHQFRSGETWLVYATLSEGRVAASMCSRTRPLSAASPDLAYLEGLADGRQQGLVFGEVLRRAVDVDGQPASLALFEPLQVVAIAVGDGRRYEVTTDKWGPYQLVLPPGDFDIWGQRQGQPVTAPVRVSIYPGRDHQVTLVAEYPDR